MAVARRPTKEKNSDFFLFQGKIDTFMPNFGSKFRIPIALKFRELFDMSKICQKYSCDGLRWFKLGVKMSSCQKDVKCKIVKHLDYGGGSQKNKLT